MKFICGIELSDCFYCGALETGEGRVHILDGDEKTLLCGDMAGDILDDYPIEYEYDDIKELPNICTLCKRDFEDFSTAKKNGFKSLKEFQDREKTDKAKYKYWMKYGSLAGYDR